MSKLESATKPFLTPMVLGKSLILPVEAQTLIARWAVKTAVKFHYTYPSNADMPRERLEQVRVGPEPPFDSAVWIVPSASSVQPAEYEIKSLVMHTAGASRDTNGELFTICIGQLALQVLSITLDDVSRTIRISSGTHPIRIWPSEGVAINWPPPYILNDDQLVRLFLRFTPDVEFPFNRPT